MTNIKSKDLEPHKEDIPFPEYWERVNVEKIKQMFNDWLDNNIEHEYMEDPEFYLKDDVNEKRFYMRVNEQGYNEQGYTDEDPEDEGYFCIVKPFETKRVEMLDD